MTSEHPIEFGTREAGKVYQARPGSYAVVIGAANTVAVMHTNDHGNCLSGGGAERGETAEGTLRRELLEECGHEVETMKPIGIAVEYLRVEGEGNVAKQCSFYDATLGKKISATSEPDHTLVWLPIQEAIERLSHRSQSWILSQFSCVPSDEIRDS